MNKFLQFLIFSFVIIFTTELFAQVPFSQRSKEAIKRVYPRLNLELNAKKLEYGSEIFIRIFKESKELEVWIERSNKFEHFKTYKICTYGSDELGPKVRKGDGKAPEGFYIVTSKSMNPSSNFHLSFNLGYPNEYDRLHKRTGSALMVHGNCVSIGCYAMTDEGIEEIYSLAAAALNRSQKFFKVDIFPFRMTDENMKKYSNSEWIDFWKNLKEGYDHFEKNHIPPEVRVENQKYLFR
ncbi:MAG: murein L,D-transpeptidase [Desulfobacterales bacterium]|nr:murein L,D-transpeptidase [Desulfobacterales bacterium]